VAEVRKKLMNEELKLKDDGQLMPGKLVDAQP